MAIGASSIIYGVLTFLDWQWLSDHFGQGGSSHWTQDVISGFFVRAILFFVVGGLGVVTFLLGFLKVRKALDDDNQDAIKLWSLLTGAIGAVPGVGLGGLLEIFIWRAHVSDKFTIFGLLGKAPEAPPEPPSAMVVAHQQAEEDEARRKQEYAALFGGASAPAPSPAPAAQGSMASAYASDSGFSYGAPQEAMPPPAQPDAAVAQPEAAPAEPAPAEPAAAEPTQYHEQPGGAPICTCGRPMEWIAEYSRWYCYTDDRYEGEA